MGGRVPQAQRMVNDVLLIPDAIVLEEGRSAAGPYVLWYIPFNSGWKGEPAVLVFASTPTDTGRGMLFAKSVLEKLTAACA